MCGSFLCFLAYLGCEPGVPSFSLFISKLLARLGPCLQRPGWGAEAAGDRVESRVKDEVMFG